MTCAQSGFSRRFDTRSSLYLLRLVKIRICIFSPRFRLALVPQHTWLDFSIERKPNMPSRLWQHNGSSREFVQEKKSHSENAQDSGNSEQLTDSGATSVIPSSNEEVPTLPFSDSSHGKARQPQFPRSDLAVEDGRKLLAAFREKRDRGNIPESKSGQIPSFDNSARKRHIDLSHAPSVLGQSFGQRFEKNQSISSDISASLEAALQASLNGRCMENVVDGDPINGSLAHNIGDTSNRETSSSTTVEERSGMPKGGANFDDYAMEPVSSSTEQPTPEMLRQAARTSQAAFLSTVLPLQDFRVDHDHRMPRTPMTPKRGTWNSKALAMSQPLGQPTHRSVDDETDDPGTATSSAAADQDAATIWASLQRLQDQSFGLGSAAEQQLGRALNACRDLRRCKGGVGAASGGPLSEHERTSCLEALDSTLRGLEEVLSKRTLIDRAARREADALGGPAMITSMMDGADASRFASEVEVEAEVGGDVSSKGENPIEKTPEKEQDEAHTGWLSGAQLRAFAKQIQTKSSLEIAALESERRKLRSKVDMFQRQVQLLQREEEQSNASNGSRSGAPIGLAGRDGVGSFNSRRFASRLDARLGEERHIKATLEAEIASLRDALEEKDGLIDALREAVYSSAPSKQANGDHTLSGVDPSVDPPTPIREDVQEPEERNDFAQHDVEESNDSQEINESKGKDAPQYVEENSICQHAEESETEKDAPVIDPRTDAVVQGLAVPGRGVFAPIESRSRGRYHSRSSRLLGSVGPVATARAVAVAGQRVEASPFQVPQIADAPRNENVGGRPARQENIEIPATSIGNMEATGDNAEVSPVFCGPSEETSEVNGDGANIEIAVDISTEESKASRVDPTTERFQEGDGGMVDRATAATGTALRMFWDSTRTARSKVGLLDSGKSNKDVIIGPRLREKSSHAVLIL